MTKFFGVLLLVMVTIFLPISAPAEDLEINQPPGTVPAALVDLMVVRPLFSAGALVPTSAFVATLPVTYTLNRDLQFSKVLVQKPWIYVADRPLGIFFPGKSITTRIDEKMSEQYQEYFIQAGVNRPAVCIK